MTIAVLGLAATGLATALVLRAQGHTVVLHDSRPESALDPARIARARAAGIAIVAGTDTLGETEIDRVVPSPGVPRTARPLVEARARGIPIEAEIEVAGRIARAPILGVTGTNGKTTTTLMLAAICEAAGRTTVLCGNVAQDDGVRVPLIEAAVTAGPESVLVAELSSFQLEWTGAFRPKVGAWLNLTADHLDRYPSLDAYAADKAKLFQAQTASDVAVLAADDPTVWRFAAGKGTAVRHWFGAGSDRPGPGVYVRDGVLETVTGESLLPARDLAVPGAHNALNAAAAAAMALAFGIEPEAVVAGLRAFTGVPHRLERVSERAGVRYVNNSMCTNPAAVAASLAAFAGPVIAIAGGRHKGDDREALVRALLPAHRVLLIGESAPWLIDALQAAGHRAVEIVGTIEQAVPRASVLARFGDTVLLVPGCSSFDQFTSFEARGQAFRVAVRNLS